MDIRIVFMGSPEFALPTLKKLSESFMVVGIVTQPDRPAGRGKVIKQPPIKELAVVLNIPTIQPDKLTEPEAIKKIRIWDPDLIVVAAYGQILRKNILTLPKFGCLNVHASLLPRWRGATPIQASIAHGDQVAGITIMKMDEGLDTGPILSQKEVVIFDDDTGGTLEARLADVGADLLVETVHPYLDGSITPQPQVDGKQTYAGRLKKRDGKLDFQRPAEELACMVRAYNPWPGAFTLVNGEMFKVHRAHSLSIPETIPGKMGVVDGFPAIGSADGWLVLDELQPAGKKPMSGKVFLHGSRHWDHFCGE